MRAWITAALVIGSISVAAAQGGQTSQQTTQQTTNQTTTQTTNQTTTQPAPQTRRAGDYAFYAYGQNPVFEIAVRRYDKDGTLSGLAGDSASQGDFQSYVWTSPSLCGLSASSDEPSNVTGHGWHIKGSVVSRTAEQVNVRIDWRRMWDSGKRVSDGASGSKTVAMRNGERLELDRVVPSGATSCGAAEAKLEATFASPATMQLATTQNWMVSPDGRFVVGGRGGGGAAASRGTTGTTTTNTTQGGARGGGAGRGATQPFTLSSGGFAIMGIGAYDAELWLVHRRPDGTETVQQQNARFSGGAFEAKFPPVSVQSSGGPITIDVTAKLQAFVGNPPTADSSNWQFAYVRLAGAQGRTSADPNAKTEPTRVMLTIARRARASGNPTIDTTGSSAMAMDMPKPEDVPSFEFPPLQKATEDLLKGHVFSLRVRITPAK